MIYNSLKYLWMGMAFLWIVGCNGDDSYMYRDYCESYGCKPSTEVLQRPTSFALELQQNDSTDSWMAKLYTLDCQFLPGEDTTELSTFCVDSLKYGKSDSLRHLPQKNKNSYERFSVLSVKGNGSVLEKYAQIPIDDDDHLRFTLVDRKNKKKAFDLDLSSFIKMYELHGDTFDFKFPDSTSFGAYTRDTTFDVEAYDSLFTLTKEWSCYHYEYSDSSWIDTTLYCHVRSGDSYDNVRSAIVGHDAQGRDIHAVYLEDTSACLSHQFYVDEKTVENRYWQDIPCYKLDMDSTPSTLTISNLYSVNLMSESIKDSLGEKMRSDGVYGGYHVWHTISQLGRQGPDKEDHFIVYMHYSERE